MGSSKNSKSQVVQVQVESALASQLVPVLGNITILVGNESMTTAQMEAVLQEDAKLVAQGNQQRAALHATVAARKGTKTQSLAIQRAVKNYVATNFGTSSDKYTALGFTVPTRRVPTPAVKAAASEKAQETRKARGILGPRQRAAIHAPAPTPTPTSGNGSGSGSGNGSGSGSGSGAGH
jgi:hypothetical protein